MIIPFTGSNRTLTLTHEMTLPSPRPSALAARCAYRAQALRRARPGRSRKLWPLGCSLQPAPAEIRDSLNIRTWHPQDPSL